jgi:hypothetical protein
MRRNFARNWKCRSQWKNAMARARSFKLGLIALVCASTALAAANERARERIHLEPHLVSGSVFHYRMELRTKAIARATGPITDPQGATTLIRNASTIIRLEVMRVDPVVSGGTRVHMRATFEHCSATSQTDALDVQEDRIDREFRKLEGVAMEFDLEPDGRTDNYAASGNSSVDPSILLALQESANSLAPAGGLPRQGIAVGDTWSSVRVFQPAPLTGLYWKTQSRYLRDEPCPRAEDATPSAQESAQPEVGTCAVIQTDLQLVPEGKKPDQTPPDYLHNGLRTSGTWEGSAESVTTISHRTGLVVTMTETGSQNMDFTVRQASGNGALRYIGHLETQTLIAQIP